MPQVEVTDSDYEKAMAQKALFEELLVDYQLNPEANADKISRIKADIAEIAAEAKVYDYKLNPRSKPELCGTCNAHRYVDMPNVKCASCGLTLIKARPPDGVAHWVIQGEESIARPITDGEP